jgi:hypothetical protein
MRFFKNTIRCCFVLEEYLWSVILVGRENNKKHLCLKSQNQIGTSSTGSVSGLALKMNFYRIIFHP